MICIECNNEILSGEDREDAPDGAQVHSSCVRPALDSLQQPDPVNPSHYSQGGIEAIDVIEAYGLGFCAGNTVKYVLRHRFKVNPLEDLKKARWYLDRLIQQHEKGDSDEQGG